MQDTIVQGNSAGSGQLPGDRIREFPAEVDALRRENEVLRLADTKRRRSEEALCRENEWVDAIPRSIQGNPLSTRMVIVWVNQKARKLFPTQNPAGDKCYRLFEGMDKPCEVCVARVAHSTGEIAKIEKYVPYRGRWFSIVAQPVRAASTGPCE